ncbi:MAG: HD domain-containing phosphohydrolase [Dehalococcoidia bacterium]
MLFNEAMREACILIVDDQQPNVMLLDRILQRAGYRNLHSTTDSHEVVSLYQEWQPDLLLLDLQMPPPDGFAVMAQLAGIIPATTYFPILVLTADMTKDAKQRALASGAKDFLTKPFDAMEVLLRLTNLLETRFLHQQMEEKVHERTKELDEARLDTLSRLALVAEFRDDLTAQHTRRVGEGSAVLAQTLGLPNAEVELIRQAAPLHDLGKIGIPDNILLKPDVLTVEEFERMKTHTSIGATLLSGSRSPVLQLGEQLALTHHERWDGRGYRGLQGEAIPLVSRIVSVVDVYDALTNARPYKQAWPVEKAVAELERQNGQMFDPIVVETFLRLIKRGSPAPGSSETRV